MENYIFYRLNIIYVDGRDNYYGVESNGIMKELVTGKIVNEANPNFMPPIPGLNYTHKFRVPYEVVSNVLSLYMTYNEETLENYIKKLQEAEQKCNSEYEGYLEAITKMINVQKKSKMLIKKMNGEL